MYSLAAPPCRYSIVFQATSTLSTGVVSEIIMGEPLTMAQWGSLAVLICGFCLTLPGFDPYDMTSVFASLDGGAGGTGLAITTFGTQPAFPSVLYASTSQHTAPLLLSLSLVTGGGVVAVLDDAR